MHLFGTGLCFSPIASRALAHDREAGSCSKLESGLRKKRGGGGEGDDEPALVNRRRHCTADEDSNFANALAPQTDSRSSLKSSSPSSRNPPISTRRSCNNGTRVCSHLFSMVPLSFSPPLPSPAPLCPSSRSCLAGGKPGIRS